MSESKQARDVVVVPASRDDLEDVAQLNDTARRLYLAMGFLDSPSEHLALAVSR